MTIAITGADGFIGSNVARRLAELGHELICVDLGMQPRRRYLSDVPHRYLHVGAFTARLAAGTLDVAGIIHLGAETDTRLRDTRRFAANIRLSQQLWQWCAERGRRFLYASSAATYGADPRCRDTLSPEFLTPLTEYGRGKNDFDLWATQQAAAWAAPPQWAGVKFFNVYGPHEEHKRTTASFVRQGYEQIVKTGKLKLFRDGTQQRDFIHVDDAVSHLLELWNTPDAAGLYNSGTGTATSFRELAELLFATLQRPVQIELIDMPADLVGRYQEFTQADMTRLGHVPVRSLADGVKQYVDHLRQT